MTKFLLVLFTVQTMFAMAGLGDVVEQLQYLVHNRDVALAFLLVQVAYATYVTYHEWHEEREERERLHR